MKELFDCQNLVVVGGCFLELVKLREKKAEGERRVRLSGLCAYVCVGVHVRAVLIPDRFEEVPPRHCLRSARRVLEGSQNRA